MVVDEVTLEEGGFVTMHDSSLGDDEVLGSVRATSTYLVPGTHTDVEVSLDQSYEIDGTVIAMPHRDTNGNQMYDFVEDAGAAHGPYVAAGGAVVAAADLTVESDAMDDTETTTSGEMEGDENQMNPGEDETEEASGSDGQPGFGVAIAVLAVLSATMLVRRS